MDRRKLLTGLLFLAVALAMGAGPALATNYANSPIIPKFADPLPAITIATPQAPPPGVPNDGDYYEIGAIQTTWPFSSSLPATTKVRGYVQLQTGTSNPVLGALPGGFKYLGPMIVATKGRSVRLKFTNLLPPDTIANRSAGNLFLPVDTNLMGAGMGPLGLAGTLYSQNRTSLHLHGADTPWISDGTPHQWITPAGEVNSYLKGISQQNVPDMPIPPAGSETLYYPNNLSGRLLFYHDHAFGITRLHIYAGIAAPYLIHDPAEDALIGANPLAPITLPTGGGLTQGTAFGIPLVIQDRTFVPANIATQDPDTVNAGGFAQAGWNTVAAAWGGSATGDLWFPHVYEFNQSAPATATTTGGVNPQGRWDYGPYVWPPATIADTTSGFANSMGMPQPSAIGDVRSPSAVPEGFMDTMVVNGKAYPTLQVDQKTYRFRILNACNDRTLNLQLYYAANSGPFPAVALPSTNTAYASNITNLTSLGAFAASEVSMVKADGTTYTIPAGSVQFNNPIQTNEANQLGLKDSTGTTVLAGTQVFYVPPAGQPLAGQPTATVPFDGRAGGVPDPRQVGPQMIQIGNEGGLLPAPIVLASNPVDYTYDRKQITFGNVRNYPLQTPNPAVPSLVLTYPHPGCNLHMGPAERADVVIDFSSVPTGSTLILYNDNPAPEPGFDPRYDYYTGDPDYSNATGLGMGGAPSTTPGFGPNTRTIMQIHVVAGVDPTYAPPATMSGPTLLANLQSALPTYFAANQPAQIIPEPPVAATANYGPITLVGGQSFAGLPVYNKTIAEDFDPIWGRMNAMLGTEQASTNSQGQQTFGFHYTDSATETINPFRTYTTGTVNPALNYGNQLWKFTHNGVDTHSIHFHLYNVQVINRVDWAGMVKPPDPNEVGWKETVRMNPLEDIIVALKPKLNVLPASIKVNNSLRPMDPTMPVGMTNAMFWTGLPAGAVVPNFPFTNPGPGGVTAVNNPVDLGWEYVMHCHLLGHEENDMMRPVSVQVAPAPPTKFTATNGGTATVNLSWTNNSTDQTKFTFVIQRATNGLFTQNLTVSSLGSGATNLATYSTTNILPAHGTYYYRMRSQNAYGGASFWSPTRTVTY